MFCCEGLESLLNNKDSKGFSISRKENTKGHDLIFRSVDKDKEELLINFFKEKFKNVIGLPKFTISGRVNINYCPQCGKKIIQE